MTRTKLYVVVCFAAFTLRVQAQSGCTHPASCNTSINGTLDFAFGTCLDSSTRRFDAYTFTGTKGNSMSASVQSAFFAPAIRLVSPSNAEVAADSNGSSTPRAVISYTFAETGTYTVIVRNINVGDGGPYTLTLACATAPPAPAPRGFALGLTPVATTLERGQSTGFHLTSTPVSGFNGDVNVSIGGLPQGITVSRQSATFPAPGSGSVDFEVTATPSSPRGTFGLTVVGISPDGTSALAGSTVTVTGICNAPILSSSSSAAPVAAGAKALLSIRPGGTPPFAYQWFKGFAPSAVFPIAGATNSDYETGPLTSQSQFWVRVTNECGSRDSSTITVDVKAESPAPGRHRSVRH
jgi:hypothetical protein